MRAYFRLLQARKGMTELGKFQDRLRLKFNDLSLLQRALTHRSYLNEHPEYSFEDNERLEFLGDAVLDFIAGALLYHRFPEMDEGQLTRLRAALVRTETLAGFARRFQLGDVLLLGRGEAESGGRTRQRNLCGAFEALVGAVYLDQGMAAARRFAEPLLGPAIDDILTNSSDKDAKSLLQEWSQATLGETPLYRLASSHGPDHAKEFTVNVLIGPTVCGEGIGHSKQLAEQAAAERALEAIRHGEIAFDDAG
jgi:ribonuclease III